MNEKLLLSILNQSPWLGTVKRTEYALAPLLPQAKQSVQFTRSGQAFTPAKKKKYVKDLNAFIRASYAAARMTGPIRVTILFCFPWRSADSKKKRKDGWAIMDKRPDVDNLLKPLLDSCSDLTFDDDGQVVTVIATKIRHDDPAIVVKLEELEF